MQFYNSLPLPSLLGICKDDLTSLNQVIFQRTSEIEPIAEFEEQVNGKVSIFRLDQKIYIAQVSVVG
jgi:hypothetical protein